MDGGTIAIIVIFILLALVIAALSVALGTVIKLLPKNTNPFERTWSEFFWQKTSTVGSFPATFLMYMPNALLMFGIIADVFSQNYRYSAASITGVLATLFNALLSWVISGFIKEDSSTSSTTSTSNPFDLFSSTSPSISSTIPASSTKTVSAKSKTKPKTISVATPSTSTNPFD